MMNEIGIYDVNTDELLLRCVDWTEAGRVLVGRGRWEVIVTENRHGDPVWRLIVDGDCVEHEDVLFHSTVTEAEADINQRSNATEEMLDRLAQFSRSFENGFLGAYARVIESAEVTA